MKREETLYFTTSSKLERLIGRELITNNTIAAFELIKNSYDAMATNVIVKFDNVCDEYFSSKNSLDIVTNHTTSICFTDNGTGMSFDEVRKYWMEIGTNHKEVEKQITHRSKSIGTMITRVMNGEKGIGRFGADKLGSHLKLISIDEGGTEKTIMNINWGDFDAANEQIQNISVTCSVETLATPENSGVVLEITGLRDLWTIRDIEKLKSQLKKFISPFSQEQEEFSIFFFVNSKGERIVNDSLEHTETYIDASINNLGEIEYQISDGLNKISKHIKSSPPVFGPVTLKILYMDRKAKYAFTKKTGVSSRQYGNIKLFRDSFRIMPYGEPDNDWLLIDNKHSQNVFRSLGTRDLLGYVQITRAGNPELKDATNRLGLNQDEVYFEKLKEFVWNCIVILQDYIFEKIKSESEKQGKIIENQVKYLTFNVNSIRNEMPTVLQKLGVDEKVSNKVLDHYAYTLNAMEKDINVINTSNSELKKRLTVMERIVGSENSLYDLLHTLKNKLSGITAHLALLSIELENQKMVEESNLIRSLFETVDTLVHSALRKVSQANTRREVFNLKDLINECVDQEKLIGRDCKYSVIFQNNNLRMKGIKESIRTIIENLMNNAYKAMSKIEDRQIYINCFVKNNTINVCFEDSGSGISKEDAPFIFNLGYTTTKGTGIGLSTSLSIAKEHQGDLALLNEGLGGLSGAAFLLTIPAIGGEKIE